MKHGGAVEMYEQGASIAEVASAFGISRQSMWDYLARRGVKFRPRAPRGKLNHFWRGGARADDHAQNKAEYAERRGKLKRRERCQKCGRTGTMKDGRTYIQKHHPDYDKPLDVVYLCRKCHFEEHARGAIAENNS